MHLPLLTDNSGNPIGLMDVNREPVKTGEWYQIGANVGIFKYTPMGFVKSLNFIHIDQRESGNNNPDDILRTRAAQICLTSQIIPIGRELAADLIGETNVQWAEGKE